MENKKTYTPIKKDETSFLFSIKKVPCLIMALIVYIINYSESKDKNITSQENKVPSADTPTGV